MRRAMIPLLLFPTLGLGQEPFPAIPPTAPEQAESTFQLLDGFKMKLIAAEPLVSSPVAIAYDENGRAYVAEMLDYPYTDKAQHKPNQENPTDKPIGRIRLLEDTNQDGVFDKSTIFADGLSWPTGVACWKGGIYVTATPDFWYLKDTTGDGVADERRQVYTGFRKFNIQAVVNNPIWGLDNHIYISGSSNGGTLTKVGHPDVPPLKMSRQDLRFDPVTETMELESGTGRFGNTFDDYGNRFLCNIRNPAIQVVLPKRALDRNPLLPPMDPWQDICGFGEFIPVHRISPVEAWREERAQRWTREEGGRHPSTELVGAGAVTSSTGITVYRGDAYHGYYRGQIFVADVASNLFLRLAVKPKGATFRASRPDTQADFCASRDVWFRPVNFVNAPDGCLHVLDMYRESIEHPWSIPDDLHARIDLERGRERGRIYRLEPEKFTHRPTPRLGDLSSVELIPFLGHRNAWHRETAQRLIFERQENEMVNRLYVRWTEAKWDVEKIHLLYALAGFGPLQGELTEALHDPSPRVREHACRLAAPDTGSWQHTEGKEPAPWRNADDQLALQTLLTFGHRFEMKHGPETWDSHDLRELVSSIMTRNEREPWLEAAIVLGAGEKAAEILIETRERRDARPEMLRSLAFQVGARNWPEDIERVLPGSQGSSAYRVAVAAGMADGLRRHRVNLFEKVKQPDFQANLMKDAEAILADAAQPAEARTAALSLYRLVPWEQSFPAYSALLTASAPPLLQKEAIQSLSANADARVAPALLQAWAKLSPEIRLQALEALLSRPERLTPLLEAVEAGTIKPHQITKARRDFLMTHSDSTIAAKAKTLFATDNRPKEEIISRYRTEMAALTADADRGKTVFNTVCLACHKNGAEGFSEIGPNLVTVKHWDPEQMLTNILDPNREISPGFIEYLIQAKDGSVFSGAVLNETDTAVLLRLPDGTRKSLARTEIGSLSNTGLSLMPEGLEAAITPQAMADLIAYLRK